jgi:hypothetical protein
MVIFRDVNYCKEMSMNKLILYIFISIFSFTIIAQEKEREGLSWPREIVTGTDTVVVYQPQLEAFDNNVIEGRMAISINTKEMGMQFGTVWFTATVNTDLDERLVFLERMDITQTG